MPLSAAGSETLRLIPSIDEVLRCSVCRQIERDLGRDAAVRHAREAVEAVKADSVPPTSREEALQMIESEIRSALDRETERRLRRVINATGVIVHTNLGRSPLSQSSMDAVLENASGYCNVELDLETGERGRRGAPAEILLAQITGAEEALIVNNCAAAALLVLSSLAEGGEVIVSRGELVEIGGDFRIPEVLERSGCRLREVGTTNRTKLSDYEKAITEKTKAILRVHPSNYRIRGFTSKPELKELAELAHRYGLSMIEDAGSGALLDLSEYGLADEPIISDSVAEGADVVCFSGDKLVGGVQAGLIVGRLDHVRKARQNPLYRALRADKIVYAATEATIRSFIRGSAFEEIPTLRMLSTTENEIRARAEGLIEKMRESVGSDLSFELIAGRSAIGGGAGPDVSPSTALIAISHPQKTADDLGAYFRSFGTPILARISEGKVVFDLRTVDQSDEETIINAFRQISKG